MGCCWWGPIHKSSFLYISPPTGSLRLGSMADAIDSAESSRREAPVSRRRRRRKAALEGCSVKCVVTFLTNPDLPLLLTG